MNTVKNPNEFMVFDNIHDALLLIKGLMGFLIRFLSPDFNENFMKTQLVVTLKNMHQLVGYGRESL